jgi:LysM repeat protein
MSVRSASARFRTLATVLAWVVSVVPVSAQSLGGSRSSVDRQNRAALEHDFSFLATSSQVRTFVNAGFLVPVQPNGDFVLHDVSYPFARREVQTFVERLSSQYHDACGERLVVTSLTRPESEQPRNASDRSVHPTGMAIDLRLTTNRSCRSWLERVLLDLERARVIEATRERRPAHYHIAVFPRAYSDYVSKQSETRLASASGEGAAVVSRPAPEPLRYRVRSGDSLWAIARKHGTTVDRLKSENALASTRIIPGQVLELPVSD